MQPKTLDHVAFWVADRDPVAEFLERHLGMHVIAREDNFTLLGSDARRGKLTLFDAEGPREQGAFAHVALRVSDLAAARAQLPDGTPEVFDAGGGIRITLVEAPTDVEYDLDHVALFSSDPEGTAESTSATGSSRRGRRGSRSAAPSSSSSPASPASPSARCSITSRCSSTRPTRSIADAKELGIEVESVVDAANTYAAFLWGPERVRIEYVEHKPTFSLT